MIAVLTFPHIRLDIDILIHNFNLTVWTFHFYSELTMLNFMKI